MEKMVSKGKHSKEKGFDFIIPEDAYKSPTRPPCPDCGGIHIVSRGTVWQCGDCGRKYVKNKKIKTLPDFSKRPCCPECGSGVVSNGPNRWMCRECGKQINKRYRRA